MNDEVRLPEPDNDGSDDLENRPPAEPGQPEPEADDDDEGDEATSE